MQELEREQKTWRIQTRVGIVIHIPLKIDSVFQSNHCYPHSLEICDVKKTRRRGWWKLAKIFSWEWVILLQITLI